MKISRHLDNEEFLICLLFQSTGLEVHIIQLIYLLVILMLSVYLLLSMRLISPTNKAQFHTYSILNVASSIKAMEEWHQMLTRVEVP